MAITYGAASTTVISAATPASITPTMPTGVVAGHLLLLFIGLRSDTAQAATPNGWTFLGGVNGGGGTFGASQGPSRMTVFYRIATGSGDTPGAVTLTSTDMAFCQVIRLTNATGNWSVAGASGSDSTVGAAWSVACDVNPGITAGDFCVVGSTNAQAASTWSAQAIAATGVTAWGTATEINEFNSTLGNDINGNTFYRAATTGTATAAPTVTATLAGTTTNARGVSFLVRAREVAAAPPVWDTSVTDRVTTMTGVVGRWRAAELGTVGGGSLADGAAVTSWPAKGVGGTLTGTGTFVASSKINQRPAIRFNGTSNKFVSPTITATTNRTIGIVLVPSSVTTQQELISIGNNEVIIQTNGAIHLWVGAGVDSAASTMVVNAADVVTASASTTANDTVHKDGTQVINAAIGTPSSTAGFELGAQGTGRWLNGDMAELVIWDHVLSTAERATWHSYVQDAYGVTVTDYVSSSVTHSSTLAATASASATVGGVTVPAAPTTITNPERGFFYYSETHAPGAAATTYNALSQTTLESERATNGRTLVFRYVILDQFLGTDTISAGFISSLAADLAAARAAGMKMILRFAYSNSGNMTPPYGSDPPVARVLTHINQLAPTLNANADIIDALQAGFIGMWGEWYYSDNFGDPAQPWITSAQQWADRKAVVDRLLSQLDARIYILIRYVGAIRKFIDAEPANTAYATRLGHHNDAFLAEANDWGTYDTYSDYSAAQNRTWLASRNQTGRYPAGGETANFNPPRSDYVTAAAELSEYRWNFLNPNYNLDVLNSWGQSGRDNVSARLGYRHTVTAASAVLNGANVDLNLTIRNDGYAAGYRNRPVLVDFVSGGTTITRTLSTDVRQWVPGINTVTGSVTAPSSGTWSVHLRVVDQSASLQSNPLYSVQLDGLTYDSVTGRNALGQSVTVVGAPVSGVVAATAAASVSITAPQQSRVAATGAASATITAPQQSRVAATGAASATVAVPQQSRVTAAAATSAIVGAPQQSRITATGAASATVESVVFAVRQSVVASTATATSTVSGIQGYERVLIATAQTSSTINVVQYGALTATAMSTSSINPRIDVYSALVFTALASATADAVTASTGALIASASASETIGVQLARVAQFTSTAGASAIIAPQRTAIGALTATSDAAAAVSGALVRVAALAASGIATSTVVSSITGISALNAVADAAATFAGTIEQRPSISATGSASATLAPALATTQTVSSSTAASMLITPQFTRTGALTASASATSAVSVQITRTAVLAATAAATSTVSIELQRVGTVSAGASTSASIAVALTVVGALTAEAVASGEISTQSGVSGRLDATASSTAVLTTTITVPGALTATVLGSAAVSGIRTSAQTLVASAPASMTISGLALNSVSVSATGAGSASVAVARTVPSVLVATASADLSTSVLGQTSATLVSTGAATAVVAGQLVRVADLSARTSTSAVLSGVQQLPVLLTSIGSASAEIVTKGQASATLMATAASSATASSALSRALTLSAISVASGQLLAVRTQSAALIGSATATALLSGTVTGLRTVTASALGSAAITDVTVAGFVSLSASASSTASLSVQMGRTGTLAATATTSALVRSSVLTAVTASVTASAVITGARAQMGLISGSADSSAVLGALLSNVRALSASAGGSATVLPLTRVVGLLASSAVALVRLVRIHQGTVEISATWTITVAGTTPATDRYGSTAVGWQFALSVAGQAPHIRVSLVVRGLETRVTHVDALESRTVRVTGTQVRDVEHRQMLDRSVVTTGLED